MTPTVVAVRITGHGTDHLSLHVNERLADTAVVEAGRRLWRERFGHDLPEGLSAVAVYRRLEAEGWAVAVRDTPVEL